MDVALAASIFFVQFYPHSLNNSSSEAYDPTYSVDFEARFDIVSIYFEGEKPVIGHYEDAFLPSFWWFPKIYRADNHHIAMNYAK